MPRGILLKNVDLGDVSVSDTGYAWLVHDSDSGRLATKNDAGDDIVYASADDLQDAIDGTVPSTATANRVYGTDGAGAQTQFPVTAPGKGVLNATSLGAISFARINADDSATLRSVANFRTDLGLGTGDNPSFAGVTATSAVSITGLNGSSRALAISGLTVTNVASAAMIDARLTAQATTNGAYTDRVMDISLMPEVSSGVTNTAACSGLSMSINRNINAANTDAGTLDFMRGISLAIGHRNTVANTPTSTAVDGIIILPTNRSGTIGTFRGVRVDPLSSSGGTTTLLNAFDVGALVNATTIYGYRGQIASTSGRWNLFMDGTASNHLRGNLLVGNNTTDNGTDVGQFTGSVAISAKAKLTTSDALVTAHSTLGATETFDAAVSDVHSGTLDQNCTFTLSNPSSSGRQTSLVLYISQNGTGGFAITWPASVKADPAEPAIVTTANTTSVYVLTTIDGGTTWYRTVVATGVA